MTDDTEALPGPGLLAGEDHDPRCLRPGEAADLLAGTPWRRAVILGEHEARLARSAAVPGYRSVSWSDRVAAALRSAHPGAACRNARGRRDLLLFEVRSRQLADALVFRGDLALVSCGGPELRAAAFDADALEVELSRILDSLKSATYRDAVVINPFDWPSSGPPHRAQREETRARQRQLVERAQLVTLHHGALHIDLMSHQYGLDPASLWGPHPGRLNSRGHALAAAVVVRALARHARRMGTVAR